MQITSGRVVYARTVQPAQYESKRAEVEVLFVVEDGEHPEDAIRDAGNIARQECLSLVHAQDGQPRARRV